MCAVALLESVNDFLRFSAGSTQKEFDKRCAYQSRSRIGRTKYMRVPSSIYKCQILFNLDRCADDGRSLSIDDSCEPLQEGNPFVWMPICRSEQASFRSEIRQVKNFSTSSLFPFVLNRFANGIFRKVASDCHDWMVFLFATGIKECLETHNDTMPPAPECEISEVPHTHRAPPNLTKDGGLRKYIIADPSTALGMTKGEASETCRNVRSLPNTCSNHKYC